MFTTSLNVPYFIPQSPPPSESLQSLDLAPILDLGLGVVQDGDLLLVTLSVAGVVQRVAGLAPPTVPDQSSSILTSSYIDNHKDPHGQAVLTQIIT